MAEGGEDNKQPIIIKKIKKGGGHHGGAWKVAYADFVTAMMAFFLLLWLLNVSTDEQLTTISNYFDPTQLKVSNSLSGAGGVLGGLSISQQGAMTTNIQNISNPTPNQTPPKQGRQSREEGQNEGKGKSGEEANIIDVIKNTPREQALEAIKEAQRAAEEEKFEEIKARIEKAIAEDPELARLKENLLIDITPEGLRIQIVDKDGEAMFPSGSARMYEKTRRLIGEVSKIIQEIPNKVSVRGHTDASAYGPGATYTNWDLSSDRANASRRVLVETGLPEERIFNVVGKSATLPLITEDPIR